MNPIPLDKIGLRWRDHRPALWWLWFLYRCPVKAWQSLSQIQNRLWAAPYILYVHGLPYIILLSILGRLFVFYFLGVQLNQTSPFPPNGVLFHAYSMVTGISYGIFCGISNGFLFAIFFGLGAMIITGVASDMTKGRSVGHATAIAVNSFTKPIVGVLLGLVGGTIHGMEINNGFAIALILGVGFTSGISITIAGRLYEFIAKERTGINTTGATGGTLPFIGIALAAGVGVGIASGRLVASIAGGVVCAISAFRLYYYPIHLAYVWRKALVDSYSRHPLAWDDMCIVPFLGLSRILIRLAKITALGEAEIERLIADYPAQRHQALRAKTIRIVREASFLSNMSNLDEAFATLPEGESGYLGRNRRLREQISRICQLQARIDTINRPFFREQAAELLCKEIENFGHRMAGFGDSTSREFRIAAAKWMEIAERQLDAIRNIVSKEPKRQLFRAGDPVDREQEAFVSRMSIFGELEQQIMSGNGCPGLVLYGRRRMGKSTILRNLNGFLPTDVETVFVSMQNPDLFSSRKAFVRSIVGEVQKRFSNLNHNDLKGAATSAGSMRSLFDFLAKYDLWLRSEGKRLLLMVDEYEAIDKKIGEGIFPLDLLSTIRESIQTHRQITWVFAGSHEITDLTNAAWTSYLVSARTIEVPAFTLAETRLLLTEPLKHSTLWAPDSPKRPRFDASFWGEKGIERIHHEAGGWPHLVQLIAETIIDLNNDEEAEVVSAEIMERALDKSITRGHNVLYELLRRESVLPGEWEYLLAFRKMEKQPPPDDDNIAASMRRRLLIEEDNGQWRLRAPLMARWLRLKS